MSERKDLTRWNRAGLSRFRYIDGNAVEYLEELRKELVRKFPASTGRGKWLNPAVEVPAGEQETPDETLTDRDERLERRQRRILDMYHQGRRDWAWEITRTFARSCHILTEHADAYANEGYLYTATQWDNVRRLVEMLDYHPAPPASASTMLALKAKTSKSGLVKKGWQVKYKPPEGGDKVIFETLEDLWIDPALNSLRTEGWDKSEEPSSSTSWSVKRRPKVSAGEVAMVLNEADSEAAAVNIGKVDKTSGQISELIPSPVQDTWGGWPKGSVSLKTSPRWRRECWLNGDNVLRTERPHGLSKGSFIGWKEDHEGTNKWKHAEVIKADKKSLLLKGGAPIPAPGIELFLLTPLKDATFTADSEAIVFLDEDGDTVLGSDGKPLNPDDALKDGVPGVNTSPFDDIFEVNPASTAGGGGGGLLPPASLPGIGSFLFPSPMLPMDLVKAAVELMLNLGVMQIPSSEEFVIKGLPLGGGIGDNINDAEALYDFLDSLRFKDKNGNDVPLIKWKQKAGGGGPTRQEVIDALATAMSKADIPTTMFKRVKKKELLSDDPKVLKGKLLTMPAGAESIATVASRGDRYVFNGTPEKIEAGDWVVASFTKENVLRALRVSSIDPLDDTDAFSLSFHNLSDNAGELNEVYADFRGEYLAEGAEVNKTQIVTGEIKLEKEVPATLRVGQDILLTAEGKESVAAKIIKIDGKTIITEPPATGFSKGELVIYGNVVSAGHGEGKPAKIIGSGDAAKSNQSFILDVKGISFVADPAKSSGVAAAIEVDVAGRLWGQVSTLKDSAPDDPHYTIGMTEEGYIKIIFGDGEHGRRLPTGKNNVRVKYRLGSGLAGNVPAGSLIKPVNPHPLVESVHQPMDAAGGGDMEDIASLRENAPSTLLTLERAVSLPDFSYLALSRSSVWQARAFSNPIHGGRMEEVTVVIVPAGGVSSDMTKADIREFLQKHTLPGVKVRIEDFNPFSAFDLKVTLRVKMAEFNAEDVKKAVTLALSDYFSLRKRKLGQHLYLSEIYKVVESVKGVENSVCLLNNDKTIQVMRASDESTVVYLKTDRVFVKYEEYQP